MRGGGTDTRGPWSLGSAFCGGWLSRLLEHLLESPATSRDWSVVKLAALPIRP